MYNFTMLTYLLLAFGSVFALIILRAFALKQKRIRIPKFWKREKHPKPQKSIDKPLTPIYTLPKELIEHYCELFDIPVELSVHLPDSFWQRLSEVNMFVFNMGQQIAVLTQQRDEALKDAAESDKLLKEFHENIKAKRKYK